MKIVQDYTSIEENKIYNKKADLKDYDSLNLFRLGIGHPVEEDSKVKNILDFLFAKNHERDFYTTKKPHYRDLPNDLSDMEI